MVLQFPTLLQNIEKGILLKLLQNYRVFLLLKMAFLQLRKLYHKFLSKLFHEFLRCDFRGSILFLGKLFQLFQPIFPVLQFEL